MDLQGHSAEAVAALVQQGVRIPAPEQVFIDVQTPLRALAAGALLLPGVRIVGPHSGVEAGAVLGEGGPVCVQNSWIGRAARIGVLGPVALDGVFVGPRTVLGSGSAEQAVFLGREEGDAPPHTCGLGFRARQGTLYEENASSAQFTDCKMSVLFPWATLGSQINFCDALLSGGTGSAAGCFSEVGSGTVHFNYTPRGDKATGSCFGDVVQGILLDQPPLFLGGLNSLIGPLQAPFGALTAAGGRYRGQLQAGLNPSQPQPTAAGEFDPRCYGLVERICRSQLALIGGLAALRAWYVHIRAAAARGDPALSRLYAQGEAMVRLNAQERSTQLLALIDRLPESLRRLEARATATDARIVQQRALLARREALAQALRAAPDRLPPPPQSLLEAWLRSWDAAGGVYTRAVQGLLPQTRQQALRWLNSVRKLALPADLL